MKCFFPANDNLIIIQLYIDDKTALPEDDFRNMWHLRICSVKGILRYLPTPK